MNVRQPPRQPTAKIAQPTADQPGTLGEQLAIASLAAFFRLRRPWQDRRESYQDARRMVLEHAMEGSNR